MNFLTNVWLPCKLPSYRNAQAQGVHVKCERIHGNIALQGRHRNGNYTHLSRLHI